jgi:DNA-binding MarR family transcriptional regulator
LKIATRTIDITMTPPPRSTSPTPSPDDARRGSAGAGAARSRPAGEQGVDPAVREIAELVRSMFREGTAIAAAIGHAAGLHPSDVHALRVLEAVSEAPTMSELAQVVGLSSAAVTGLVDRLEQSDLAHRVPDPDDRRRVRVQATPRAHDLAMEHLAPLMARIDAALAALDPADRPAVLAFLRRLDGRLDGRS